MKSVSRRKRGNKPVVRPVVKKPHKDFPLTPHPSGRWCKKVRQKVHYFGPINDPEGALNKWLAQKDDLLAGRKPRDPGSPGGPELRDLLNTFLSHKQALVDAGELRPSTFNEYHRTCEQIARYFGRTRLVEDIRPEDFSGFRSLLAKGVGPIELGKRIQTTRSVFKHGLDSGLIDKVVRFGPGFKRPSAKVQRLARAKGGKRTLDAAELRALVDKAGTMMKAAILIGANCAMGASDLSGLPLSAIDLDNGWIDYPRPKTGVDRRCKLWPETIQALRDAISARPAPKDQVDADLAFITSHGNRWMRYRKHEASGKGAWIDSFNLEFGKLLKATKTKRPGLGFYGLRRTFRTVADAHPDRPAVDKVMGHLDDQDMGARYVERIDDARLEAVADHVHAWLFGLGG